MKECDLFDEIPYKEMKETLKLDDDDEIDVDIEDFEGEWLGEWGKQQIRTQFTFTLCIREGYEREGYYSARTTTVEPKMKEYKITQQYDGSSPLSIYIGETLYYESEEEEESDEESDEEEEEKNQSA